jgi:hypothetical protein
MRTSFELCKINYQIKMFLNAFSLEQEPHIIVAILSSPLGATVIKIERSFWGQSSPGKTPNAGRLIKA